MNILLNSISKTSILEILGNKYSVLAKVNYYTVNNPTIYTKVFLEHHHVLVLSPEEDFVYFGEDRGAIFSKFPTLEKFRFKGEDYVQLVRDIQILDSVEFGERGTYEGKVDFIDYEGEIDSSKYISIGYLIDEQKRADVVGQIIDLENIHVIS